MTPKVSIETYMTNNPSPASATDVFGYQLLEQAIREFDSEVLVAPYLVQGGTDSKNFNPVSDAIYRFLMVRIDDELSHTFDGIDERIRKQDYIETVPYFNELMTRL